MIAGCRAREKEKSQPGFLRTVVLIAEPEMEAALITFIKHEAEVLKKLPLTVFAHMADDIK